MPLNRVAPKSSDGQEVVVITTGEEVDDQGA